MKIGNLEVQVGEKKQGYLPVLGCEYGIPITVICGGEGKTTLITAGVHCAEYVGIQAAIELSQELEPKDINGTLIIAPVANRSGFEHRTMSMVYEDDKNLNREFPGKEDGTTAERLAYTITKELFSKADYYIDLHSGDGYEDLYSYVYYVGPVKEETKETARSMAKCVDVKYIVESTTVSEGGYNYANAIGIPSILVERGGRGLWSRQEVDLDKSDVRRVLSFLYGQTIKGDIFEKQNQEQEILTNVIYEYASYTGCWYPEFQPGEAFKAGDVLGTIKDYFGNVLYICMAEKNGIVIYQTDSLNILEDGPMIAYAVTGK